MNIGRLKYDFKYIFLNTFVNKIPCWKIRKFLYLKFGMRLGKGSRIAINTIVMNPSGIEIGENVIINENCHLDGRGGLYIGNNTSISIYTKIITASHKINSNDFEYYEKSVNIGENVWVGCAAIILDGSIIDDGGVIGAGCVFKGKCSSNEVYVGNPAIKIKDRNIINKYKIYYEPYFR